MHPSGGVGQVAFQVQTCKLAYQPRGGGRDRDSSRLSTCWAASVKKLKGLILAQNERWRRGLGMQVEREP